PVRGPGGGPPPARCDPGAGARGRRVRGLLHQPGWRFRDLARDPAVGRLRRQEFRGAREAGRGSRRLPAGHERAVRMAATLTRPTAREAFVRSALRECARLRADPWDLALATWVPLLALALLAWMFSAGVPRELPVAVVDHDNSAVSRELVRRLDAVPALRVAARPADLTQAWSEVRALRAFAVVHVPAGAERQILRGGSAVVFAYYNASHQTAGQAALRGIGEAAQATSAHLVRRGVARIGGAQAVRQPPLRVQATVLGNAARSYEHFLLGLLFPALLHLAACLAMVGALGRELRDGSVGTWLAG